MTRSRAAGGKATLLPLDLTDGQAIDALGPSLYERFGRLDIFVGNAAILGALSPLPHIPSAHWERVLAVNVTANWRLIRTLDPLFRNSDAARVIFVTSSVARSCRPYWAPYSVSKAALEALAKTYANETASAHSIKVNLVDPGGHAHAGRSTPTRRGRESRGERGHRQIFTPASGPLSRFACTRANFTSRHLPHEQTAWHADEALAGKVSVSSPLR